MEKRKKVDGWSVVGVETLSETDVAVRVRKKCWRAVELGFRCNVECFCE